MKLQKILWKTLNSQLITELQEIFDECNIVIRDGSYGLRVLHLKDTYNHELKQKKLEDKK